MARGYIQPAVYGIPSNLTVLPSLNPGNNTVNRIAQSGVIPILGSHPDAIPRVPHQCDDEFNGTTLHQKWSWLNQGAATASVYNSSLVIHPPVVNSDNMRCQVQMAPRTSGGFTITTKMSMSSNPNNTFNQAGIFIRNSGSGKLVKLALVSTAGGNVYQLQLQRMTSPTATSGTSLGNVTGVLPLIYLRIVSDGTNLQGWFGTDGFNFHPTVQEPLSSFVISVDSFGVFADSISAITAPYAAFDSFRYLDYQYIPL